MAESSTPRVLLLMLFPDGQFREERRQRIPHGFLDDVLTVTGKEHSVRRNLPAKIPRKPDGARRGAVITAVGPRVSAYGNTGISACPR
ncbi:hypothetical protein D3C78_1490640 [compost metagenome]